MKQLLKTDSSLQVLAKFGVVISLGLLATLLLPHNPEWVNWSYSALGEGSSFSARIMNLTFLISAVLLFKLGQILSMQLKTLEDTDAAKITRLVFTVSSVCMVGIALFPNDSHHDLHLLFARSLTVVFVLYTLILPTVIDNLSRKKKIIAFLSPLFAVILAFRGMIARSMPFVVFETIFIILVVGWLIAFCYIMQKAYNQKLSTSSLRPGKLL